MKRSKKLELCKSFLSTTDLELQNAVLLLGGSPALMRLQRFRAKVATADGFKSSHRRELNWLKGLLGLDQFEETENDEFFCFAELSPEDPIVPSLCLLYEQVVEVIANINAVPVAVHNCDINQAA
ncbi:hypothetical protein [Shimia sp.]|uniref:hypothetical protein n=1 Tax=Shimia sp. TaxID=1954381 RepID=UPI0032973A9C